MFFEMRFDLGTLDSGERSLPFGLLVLKREVTLSILIEDRFKHHITFQMK